VAFAAVLALGQVLYLDRVAIRAGAEQPRP
jgi:hypothetical protein